ncbi:unnamed protein product [Closterium sp. Naga37s-1]|nr:unnamed protein product [Closterium sp. Naga37s-1]
MASLLASPATLAGPRTAGSSFLHNLPVSSISVLSHLPSRLTVRSNPPSPPLPSSRPPPPPTSPFPSPSPNSIRQRSSPASPSRLAARSPSLRLLPLICAPRYSRHPHPTPPQKPPPTPSPSSFRQGATSPSPQQASHPIQSIPPLPPPTNPPFPSPSIRQGPSPASPQQASSPIPVPSPPPISETSSGSVEDSKIDFGDFFKGDLPKKFLMLLGLLALSRVGIYIPLWGVDISAFQEQLGEGSFLATLDTLSGGGIGRLGLFSLGIVPYINAQIVFQLLGTLYPKIADLQKKEGEAGRKKAQQYMKYMAVAFGALQVF